MELRQHLGLEPLVLDRKPRSGADLPRKLLCGEVATRVTDERDLPSVPNDRSDDAPLPRGRWRNGVSGRVDEASRSVERVRHLDIGVAEACRQRCAERPRCRRRAEVFGEACDGRPGPQDDVHTPAQGARKRRHRCRPGEEEGRERGRFGILGAVQEERTGGDREGDRHADAGDRRQHNLPSAPGGGKARDHQRRDSHRAGDHGEQVSGLQPSHDLLLRSHQKDVVGAVAPAVPVEKRIPQESLADADDGSHDVEGDNDGASCSGREASCRRRQHEMKEKRRQKGCDDHRDAPQKRGRLFPADPVGREPCCAREQGNDPDPVAAPHDRQRESCSQQRQAGNDVRGTRESRAAAVGRRRLGRVRNEEHRRDSGCESEQTHAEPQYAGTSHSSERGCLHRPILPLSGRRR